MWNGQGLIEFLTQKNLSKLEKTLRSLKHNVYEALTNQGKMKALHQYIFFLSLLLGKMNEHSTWQHYFMKDTIYCLINLIHNFKGSRTISISVSNFLMYFLKQVVPDFSDTFSPMLAITINSLKYFYKILNPVKEMCLQMIHFLIVDNSCHLMDAIEKLDNFPISPEFDRIRTVHSSIKYGNSEANLEQEITFFLQHQDLSTRLDSLVHLRNALFKQKNMLNRLYDKLLRHRGFSEDCEVSLLHRLIATLAKMCCSANEKVIFCYEYT